jgi:hypothetical protein
MQRLRIEKQQADDEDDALLEQAIKLAAVEEQEMKLKETEMKAKETEMKEEEKDNCTHGYNPSSIFQTRYCADSLKTFTESYHSATRGNSREMAGSSPSWVLSVLLLLRQPALI